MANWVMLLLSLFLCRKHKWFQNVMQSFWATNTSRKKCWIPVSNVSVDVIPCSTKLCTTEIQTISDNAALRLPFYTTFSLSRHTAVPPLSSPLILDACCPPASSSPRFLAFIFFLLILCQINIMNPSFYNFYSFIYLLHWPFAPLPMPVSVWVLCQPLCQDRSPSTPASGGTEGETGRAHCHYWTGVVLPQGYSL